MYKYALILLLLLPLASFPQSKLTFAKADSLSYQYYLRGEWKQLKALTREAFRLDIDSKFMRQRAGYASFMTGDYTEAALQYTKAAGFDQADEFTREYLYYSALNAGWESSRLYAGNLSSNTAARLRIHKVNPVAAIDAEYNLKTNEATSRSNQIYYRFGINTELGYRLSLYQAFSYYEQVISNELTRQPDYFLLMQYTLSPVWQFKGAYHRLFTSIAGVKYPANVGFLAASARFNRFRLEANTSLLRSATTKAGQTGLQVNYTLPGRSNIYLTGAVAEMSESGSYRTVYSQSAGLKCSSRLWAEGNITLGNLKNYNALNALYVYNSQDLSVFRSGLTLFYFLGKHLTLIGNFTFNQQQIENSTSNPYYYYQYSYSAGIKWKL